MNDVDLGDIGPAQPPSALDDGVEDLVLAAVAAPSTDRISLVAASCS